MQITTMDGGRGVRKFLHIVKYAGTQVILRGKSEYIYNIMKTISTINITTYANISLLQLFTIRTDNLSVQSGVVKMWFMNFRHEKKCTPRLLHE